MSSGITYPRLRSRLLRYVAGTMEEGWMRPSTDPGAPLATSDDGGWNKQLAEESDSESQGKLFLAELPASFTDIRAIRYGLATVLLAAAGHSSYDVSGSPNAYTTAFWSADFDSALRLGKPSGRYRELPGGAYRRDFANGSVLVNPTSSTHKLDLRGRYTGSGLINATTATMGPETGLVLIKS
jgi:hypothetical protein